jgi:hypothetical protein
MIGAVWRAKGFLLVLVALWVVALLAGALHPIGFLAALASLGVMTCFYVALGTYVSLWSPDRRQAVGRVVLPAMLPMSGVVLLFLPQGVGSVILGTASMSFITWASLLSYEDLVAATRAGSFPQLSAVRIETGEGASRVLATVVIGLACHLIGAAFLARAACRDFDAAVGRPRIDRTNGRPSDGRA